MSLNEKLFENDTQSRHSRQSFANLPVKKKKEYAAKEGTGLKGFG